MRWVREVMADPAGGYAASQDADVGLDDDGDYFTWTRDEAAAALSPEELEVAAAYYDIGTAGEMHHDPGQERAVRRGDAWPSLAVRLGRAETEVRAALERAQAKLRAARDARPAPFVDRTRYTNWNAMMASAMLRAGAVLGDDGAREHALLTLARLRDERVAEDAVAHTPGGVTGLLDDQVQVAAAALDAHEATGEAEWLDLGGAAHGPGLGGLLGRGRRRALRYRARAGRAEPGLLPATGQAGPGYADPVAQRRGGDRLRAAARAHRRGALARAGLALVARVRGARRASSASTPRPICWPWTGSSRPPRTWSSWASRAIPWPTGCTPTRWPRSSRAAWSGASPRRRRRPGRCRRPWRAWWRPAGRRGPTPAPGRAAGRRPETVEQWRAVLAELPASLD